MAQEPNGNGGTRFEFYSSDLAVMTYAAWSEGALVGHIVFKSANGSRPKVIHFIPCAAQADQDIILEEFCRQFKADPPAPSKKEEIL